mgnify:CR=1 FL=1
MCLDNILDYLIWDKNLLLTVCKPLILLGFYKSYNYIPTRRKSPHMSKMLICGLSSCPALKRGPHRFCVSTTLVPDQQKNRARRNHRRARLTIHGSGSFIRAAVLCRRTGFHNTLAKTGTGRFQTARDFRSGVPDRGGASDQALSERRARPASRP